MRVKFTLVMLFVCMNLLLFAGFNQEDIKVVKLENGLKVLLLEDHDIPNIAMYTFFRVGSRNEITGLTGVSHFIEHMMFNGSKSVPPGEFDRKMEFMGGSNNAFTGNDMTAYTDWFPKSALEEMIKMEADRIQDATFDPEVLESERGVVSEERRVAVEDNNDELLNEQVVASAITAHPYHWDVIGWMSDIKNWKREDILKYYHTYYAPNNAVLIIVGDFETEPTIELIKKYYDTVKPGTPPPSVYTTEPPQEGTKRVEIIKEAQTPVFRMVFRTVSCTDPDFNALKVLELALLEGESSRLYRRLVRDEELALSVHGGIFETIDPYLFFISVSPKPGIDLDKLDKITIEELEKLKKDGITERELKKAVNYIKSNFYSNVQTIAGKAELLGRAEVLYGDYRAVFKQIGNFEKLSLADIKTAANKYFDRKSMTVGKLIPEGGAE